MTANEAIQAILEEVKRASRKFPEWPTDPIHAAAVVGEEAGELTQAALQFTYENGNDLAMLQEAIQTGAMAVRFLMSLEKYQAADTKNQHNQGGLAQ